VSLIREYRTLLQEYKGGNVEVSYQEDLRKWVKGPEGAAKGQIINKDQFETAKLEYYKLRGWDKQGIPTKEKLNLLNP